MSFTRKVLVRLFVFLVVLSAWAFWWIMFAKSPIVTPIVQTERAPEKPDIELINATFLGNAHRNFYGNYCADTLMPVWKLWLGKGITVVTAEEGVEEWMGAGWTGQTLMTEEYGKRYLYLGCFDHHLKKINADNGEVIWQYQFDDILKGTGTLVLNESNDSASLSILQGSRKGSRADGQAFSFRHVDAFNGRELWRMSVPKTLSYSRDVDASAVVWNDTGLIPLENGHLMRFSVFSTASSDSFNYPSAKQVAQMYTGKDHALHGGNLVAEASPVQLGSRYFIASGSGHVYGYDIQQDTIVWDFYIGSDIDGTPVATADSCLLIAIEKQYISGHGGVLKIDPRKSPDSCIVWFYPTGDLEFSSWKGGVIGSVAVNDLYRTTSSLPLAAFTGIDGQLTVVAYQELADSTTTLYDGKTKVPCPKRLWSYEIGPSISTPLFLENGQLVAAGYNGVYTFRATEDNNFQLKSFNAGIFEATPFAWNGNLYLASRDGYLYCYGAAPKLNDLIAQQISPPLTVVAKEVPKPLPPKPEVAPVLKTEQKSAPIPVAADLYIVAGVFKNKDNAERMLKKWKQRGMEAAIIIAPTGMQYVVIDSGNDGALIDSREQELSSKYSESLWVWRK